jgi:hypothetical protein
MLAEGELPAREAISREISAGVGVPLVGDENVDEPTLEQRAVEEIVGLLQPAIFDRRNRDRLVRPTPSRCFALLRLPLSQRRVFASSPARANFSSNLLMIGLLFVR